MNIITRLIGNAHTTATLVRNGTPTVERVDVTDWNYDGDTVSSAIRFGPYVGRVHADGVRIEANGSSETIRFADPLTIPAGMVFTYDLSVTVTTVS